MPKGKRPWLLVVYVLIGIYIFFVVSPFYWIFVTSIKTEKEIISFIPKFFKFEATFQNYLDLFGIGTERGSKGAGGYLRRSINFLPFLKNSLIVVPPAVLLSLLLGVPVAYALARYNFRGKESLFFFYFSQYFFPPILVLVPLYVIYQRFSLYDTYIGLIIALQLVNLPLVVLFVRGFFEEIPKEVEESAVIDGCTWWQLILRISLPLALPGIIAATFLATIFSWNNFVFGLVLVGSKKMPITVGMLNFQAYTKVQWNLMAAAAIVASVPPLVLALVFQKYIVRGLTLGAIK